MKRTFFWLILVGSICAGGIKAYPAFKAAMAERSKPEFYTDKIRKGEIQWTVEATGTLDPVLRFQVGSFVSGPIVELNVDFNDKVEKGDLLAKVDPRIYKAAVQRDQAALARAKADVDRVRATLQQAINDENRAKKLRDVNKGYLSDTEMDQLRFAREGLEAQLEVAKLQIDQATANLENSNANLEYTDIVAPVSGIVIDRKIDPGQTLAAQFQTPELFVIAPGMGERMWVKANIIEADVGHVLKAQKEDRVVKFYVDAYEGELFKGKIVQVRQNSTNEQNVVTYPVIVETPNPDMKLLPGMTATLSFEIDSRDDALLVPSSALRYLPDANLVKEEFKSIIWDRYGKDGKEEEDDFEPSAEARVEATRKQKKRYVWIKDEKDNLLQPVEIEFGMSDGKYYELTLGEGLEENSELVVGIKNKWEK
ncbi:MAG: efflux RND transporter periplasmic adaptor subunit [Planctomycetota bacterium]